MAAPEYRYLNWPRIVLLHIQEGHTMSRLILILMLPICLAGCVSFSSSDPSPPQKTTVVTPAPGTTTTICSPAPC
ncbi:hypothetical protein RN01_01385 [Cupriavidus sp. SHE]|jgi:hypothetical protein|nr:hypothetical protein RN01_01385 [Cupriavidus sp. SHE]